MNGIAFAGAAESAGAPHTSKNYDIIVALDDCLLECTGEKYELPAGGVAVIPPLSKYTVKGNALQVCLEQALLPFKGVRVLRDDSEGGIAHAAKQAATYFTSENSTQDGILAAFGGLLVAYVTAFGGGENLSPVIVTVRDDIKKNVSTPLFSLEDSIKKLPLNYDYVRKLFKKEMGVTPHEYLLECRMQLARELLTSGIGNRYSNYSVGQIAEACGFSEPLYFSRVFKKFYGFAPTEAKLRWSGGK